MGLPASATRQEIRKAFLDAVKINHPDVNHGSATRFFDLQEAYKVLHDPTRREAYDSHLRSNDQPKPILLPEIIVSRPFLSRIPEPQRLYFQISLNPGQLNTAKLVRAEIDLVLLVDISSSMKGQKLDEVKLACFKLLGFIQGSDRLRIITFNDFANVLVDTHDSSKVLLHNKVHSMQAQGGTELFAGLNAGYEAVCSSDLPNLAHHIVLLTDGQTYGDEAKCAMLAEKAAAAGITISCYGIGADWNDRLLEEIAMKTGGSCRFLRQGTDFNQTILNDILMVTQSDLPNITGKINIQSPDRVVSAFRLQPNPIEIPNGEDLRLGPLPKEGDLEFFLEIEVGPIGVDEESHDLFTMDLLAKHGQNPSAFIGQLDISMPVEGTTTLPMPPAEILKTIHAISINRIEQKARYLIEQGKTPEAIQLLRKLTNLFQQNGKDNLAKTINLQINAMENGSPLSKDADKEIHFKTRALFTPNGELE